MKTVTFTKIIPLIVALVVCSGIKIANGNVQDRISDTNAESLVTYYSVQDFSSQIPELQNKITLDLIEVKRSEALFQIAQKGNLEIAFNPGLIDNETLSITDNNITIADALKAALHGSNYESVITQRGEIVLREKEKETVVELEELQTTVTGRVTDSETNEVLVGVTVVVGGTNVGTTTDTEGNFSLNVPDDGETLVFSYVGYVSQEVSIDGQTEINVALVPDVAMLDDVVVVGYGTQQRREVTGSVSSIRGEQVRGTASPSFENAMQGQVAGVEVAESSGEPGAAPQINIRGVGSISAGNNPLYVIDGVPISLNFGQQDQIASQRASFQPPRVNPMASLNPNDIESVEVLKDASAAAIYGSRGSNGVILITTRQGSYDTAPQINVRSSVGVQSVFNLPELMNSEELIEYTKDARNNTYIRQQDPTNPDSQFYNPQFDPDTNAGREESGATGNHLIPEAYVNWDGTDTDWLDLVLDNGTTQNYDMSISGGSENVRYAVGGGFSDQSGIIEGSGFSRYSLNAKLNADLSDRIQIGLGINAAFNEHVRQQAGAPYFGTPPGIIYSAMTQSPVVDPFNEDGTYRQTDGSHNDLGGAMTTTNHPLAIRDFIDEQIDNNRIFGNVNANYLISDNLNFRTMVGYDVDNYQRSFFQGTQLSVRGGAPQPFGQSSSAQSVNWLWENTLDYQTDISENQSINILAGFTAQRQNDERNRVVAENFPDDQVKTVNGGQVTGGSQTIEEWSLVSYLARANYTLLDRYLVTATVRTDRSSRFGSENQTGVFPSVSVGWLMTNEPFMSDIDLFSELKPRISYGVTGNFEIPNYGSIGLLTGQNYVIGGRLVPGVVPLTLGNEELTWETTKQLNAGLDFAMLEDRIYGSIDYYISNTEDLLLDVNVPAVTGFTTALTNIGEVENRGFEFQITSRNVVGTSFNWSTDFNFSMNRNEVKRLGPEGDPILVPGAAGVRHITRVGDPIGSYYGYDVVGIFQNQSEIDNAPVDMEGNPTPGDFQFRDVNGDGVIDADDRTVIGNYQPDFTWGITNRLNWRNLDFSFFFQGVEGREVLNLTARHLKNGEANFNSYAVLNDRWRSEADPGSGEHPKAERASGGNNNRPSSYQVEDGSYIKLRNVTFGYSLPDRLIQNFAQNVRVFGVANNVAIWTDYIGFNPEVNLQPGNALNPGEDYGAFPLSRSFQIGIDISFN